MADKRVLVVEVIGDTRKLERSFGRAQKSADGFGEAVKRGSQIAGTAILGGLAVAAKVGVSELLDMQKAMAQTNAVIKSTGKAANVTADHVSDLAKSLLEVSGVDDELIQQGENMLLTFKNVRNEVGKGNDIFDQATKVTLDLSVAMGKDMQSSAILVGKALNDPIRGLAALTRVGVQFSAEQRTLIASLVASGHEMEAQKVILAELESQFGGSAEAAGQTMAGQLNIAKESFKNLTAEIIVGIMPTLLAVTRRIQTLVRWMDEHRKATKIILGVLAAFGVALVSISAIAKAYRAAVILVVAATKAWTAAQWLLNIAMDANPVGAVIVAVAALTTAIVVAYKRSERFRNIVQSLWQWLRALAKAAADAKKAVDDLLPDAGKLGKIAGLGLGGLPIPLEPIIKGVKGALNAGAAQNEGRGAGLGGTRGPRSVTITGPVHVYGVQNRSELLKDLQKEAGRRSGSRRGPNAGATMGIG